jgi:hypothetical protein
VARLPSRSTLGTDPAARPAAPHRGEGARAPLPQPRAFLTNYRRPMARSFTKEYSFDEVQPANLSAAWSCQKSGQQWPSSISRRDLAHWILLQFPGSVAVRRELLADTELSRFGVHRRLAGGLMKSPQRIAEGFRPFMASYTATCRSLSFSYDLAAILPAPAGSLRARQLETEPAISRTEDLPINR